MAPPLERWYLGLVKTPGDLEQSLRNLERILARKDEILAGAPIPPTPPDPQAGDLVRYDGSQWVTWSPKWMVASLSAAQTANLTAGNHVEFDDVLSTSGHITLSSGADQADGIFTLPEGVWIVRVGNARATFGGATGTFTFAFRDGGGVLIGTFGRVRPYSAAVNQGEAGNTEGILDNRGLGSVNVELRIEVGSGNLTAIDAPTLVTITALA